MWIVISNKHYLVSQTKLQSLFDLKGTTPETEMIILKNCYKKSSSIYKNVDKRCSCKKTCSAYVRWWLFAVSVVVREGLSQSLISV